jgi:predicted MFS family arabinose efflux permease
MISPASTVSRQAWLVVALLWFVACLNYLDRMILITMRTSIKEAIPMTDAQFGLLTTIFLVSYGLLSPLGGFVADRFSRSKIIIFSLFAWSGTTWLTAHASTFGELLFYRALMGISEACYFPAAGALLMDYHRNTTRSLANGIHLSGVMVGSGLGGLGGYIADRHPWTFVFQLFGVIGVVYSVVLFFLLKDRPAEVLAPSPVASPAKTEKGSLVEAFVSLFSRPAYIVALLFWGLLGLASWSFIGWLPTYLTERFGLSQGEAGLTSMGYVYAGSLVGMVVSGFWADRWSKTSPRARIWVGVIGVLLATPAILIASNASVLAFVLIALVVYGFARPFPDANMVPILCQIIEPRFLATGVGFLNMFAVFVGGATIYAGGALRDAQVNITTVFNFGALGLLICAALLWFVREPAAKRDAVA